MDQKHFNPKLFKYFKLTNIFKFNLNFLDIKIKT